MVPMRWRNSPYYNKYPDSSLLEYYRRHHQSGQNAGIPLQQSAVSNNNVSPANFKNFGNEGLAV
jgi:hypothetical protein